MIELTKIQAKNWRRLSKKCLQDLASNGHYHEFEKSGILYVLIVLSGERNTAMIFRPNSVGNWRLVARQSNININKLGELMTTLNTS